MGYIKTVINGLDVLVETNDELVSAKEESLCDISNDATEKMKELSKKAFLDSKHIIESIAKEYSTTLHSIDVQPDELEIEFNLSFSINSNLWVLGSESNIAFKVKLKWKK